MSHGFPSSRYLLEIVFPNNPALVDVLADPTKDEMTRLDKVKGGKLETAKRFLFYGTHGIGKSSLAADAPKPIFFDLEDGTAQLDVARYPFGEGVGGHVPNTLEQIYEGLEDLILNDHTFETLVIDTADRLEAFIWSFICKRDGKRDIEAYGYGKGYQIAIDEWRKIYSMLDRLRLERGVTIVLLGHTHVKTFKNPEGADYDRYRIHLHDKSGDALSAWCDVVCFCVMEGGAGRMKTEKKAHAYNTDRRIIHTVRTATYDAKTRIDLPAEIDLTRENPWAPFAAHRVEQVAKPSGSEMIENIGKDIAADLCRQIKAECTRIGDETMTENVEVHLNRNQGDVNEYRTTLANLKKRKSAA